MNLTPQQRADIWSTIATTLQAIVDNTSVTQTSPFGFSTRGYRITPTETWLGGTVQPIGFGNARSDIPADSNLTRIVYFWDLDVAHMLETPLNPNPYMQAPISDVSLMEADLAVLLDPTFWTTVPSAVNFIDNTDEPQRTDVEEIGSVIRYGLQIRTAIDISRR